MNPRKVTLTYLGWCPGVRSAGSFLPDREISSAEVAFVGVSLMSLMVLSGLALQNLTAPPPGAPLMITINGETYDDSQFPVDFDYATIRDAVVKFYTPLDNGEFAKSGREVEELSFESIDDTVMFLEGLGTPNIVKGFVPWISRGSFDEAYLRFYGHSVSDSMLPEGAEPYIDLVLGDHERGCYYEVTRATFQPRGITVIKLYLRPGSTAAIWFLSIEVDSPPYEAMFVRYPPPTR